MSSDDTSRSLPSSFPRDAMAPKHTVKGLADISTVTGMLYQWPKSVNSD